MFSADFRMCAEYGRLHDIELVELERFAVEDSSFSVGTCKEDDLIGDLGGKIKETRCLSADLEN